MPHLGQNDALSGSGCEQNVHLDSTERSASDLSKKVDVVRIMITKMKMMKPRMNKILTGSDALKKKNGKMKNTLFSKPPLLITKRATPSKINMIPNDRKF